MSRLRPSASRVLSTVLTSAILASAGPCDIYAAGNTPCIAAHSTTRALFSDYSGALYQVTRASDNQIADIKPLTAGGVADAGSQDDFCANTKCEISIIYDQTTNLNHLSRAPKGAFDGPQPDGSDNLADAGAAPVLVGGSKAYGVFIAPGTGYRNNQVKGSATGDGAEGMYAVLDGTHFNDRCCFDYGNAETNSLDTGNGHMEAIYFGNNTQFGFGTGDGPWVMADLENGLYAGRGVGQAPDNPSITFRFTTAVVKGQPGNNWAIRGGDAANGPLTTYWNGVRPDDTYNPMQKEGAIILGIGGDNSNGGQGTFYEGVMTTGFPSDATEDSVQADIVAAKYSLPA